MSTLQQVKSGLSHAWDSVSHGWRELSDRAGDALTRFTPHHDPEKPEEPGDRLAARSARWGLLAAEVSEKRDSIEVALELPGMDAEDFNIEVIDNTLVVSGEKRVSRDRGTGRFQVLERAYGRFQRAIPLPTEVDDSKATANYDRGVLTVTLPRTERAQRRRISVAGGR